MTTDTSINPFVEKTYQDTYDLLVSIRDYISGPMEEEAGDLEVPDQLRLTRELSSMTRDLTDAMAWLMLQKAIDAGELTPEEADAEPAGKLGQEPQEDEQEPQEDEEADDAEGLARLPLTARSLIDRSRRVCAMVRQLASGHKNSGN